MTAKPKAERVPRTYCPACGNRVRVKKGVIVAHVVSLISECECPGTGEKPKKFQPDPRWPVFMTEACARISAGAKWAEKLEPEIQIAAEIVRHGDGEKFLKAVRRGRPTARQNLRYRLLREVERLIGAGVPRRREDRNTPEAAPFRGHVDLLAGAQIVADRLADALKNGGTLRDALS